MISRKAFCTIALGLVSLFVFSGCPWSSSPNIFDGAKGISIPSFNSGPPPQSEPPVEDFSPPEPQGSDVVEFD